MDWLLVLAFGSLGTAARFATDKFFPQPSGGFPATTLAVNAAGCFAAGLIYVLAQEKGLLSPQLRLGLIVGFCGGFTTFSAYGLQTLLLAEQGQIRVAIAYFAGSPVIGAAATFAGFALARSL